MKKKTRFFVPVAILFCVIISAMQGTPTVRAWAAETAVVSREQSAEEAAQAVMEYSGAVSVVYAIIEGEEITLNGSAGVFSRNEDKPISTDTLYGIGSVSKVFTAAAVMKLVEQGKVSLDEPVITYIPEFTMRDERYRDITVRMLLNHS